MAKWLGQASQGHETYCHDLEVIGSNHNQVEHDVRSHSEVIREAKI